MKKKEMKSAMEIEVHDSGVTDIVEEEVEDVQKIQVAKMREKQFSWQGDVPRDCDFTLGPNWGEQQKVEI